jgi:hypothetical protein
MLKQRISYEQQLYEFTQTLKFDEKIIVSREDLCIIIKLRNSIGNYVTCVREGVFFMGIKIEPERINNFCRVELGETRTNRNFELIKITT